jgi:hypothetical protein
LKGAFLVISSFIFTLLLCSCGSSDSIRKPTKTEVIDFDIQTATQIIGEGDKIIANIAIKDAISRQEYNQFLNDIAEAYDGYEEAGWEYMLFYNYEFKDNQIETLRLNKDMFYPTIYHKDVEVVSAKIINTYYQNESRNTSELVIREEYIGEDSKLKTWFREYIYKENDNSKWVFYRFNGRLNFMGQGFTYDYLGLK